MDVKTMQMLQRGMANANAAMQLNCEKKIIELQSSVLSHAYPKYINYKVVVLIFELLINFFFLFNCSDK